MANLIRLKQIESGSQLDIAAGVGASFTSSVFEIIDGAGLVSSSAQITLLDASGYAPFVASLNTTLATDYELQVTSSQIIDQGEW